MPSNRAYNKYQYETSPRKLKPEYVPKKNPYEKKESSTKKIKKSKTKPKHRKISKTHVVMYIAIGFATLFTISYRNSQINEDFSKSQSLKKELGEIQKENDQLNISIQNSLNLNQVEQSAKELLGMQKLTNKQKIFISLPKRDYIEAGVEQIVIEEDQSVISKIFANIKNIF